MRTILSLLILSQAAFAAGERELIAVLSARVRYSLVPQMNDEPPTEKNRLLNGTVIDAGTVSALEYANLELQSENEDLYRENRILADNLKASLGAGKSERRDAATDGNASEHVLAKQPDAEWTRPPVSFRAVMWGPSWCGVCISNDAELSKNPHERVKYEHRSGDEATFPKYVRDWADAHGWPVWSVEHFSGQWVTGDHAKTWDDLIAMHENQVGTVQTAAERPFAMIPFANTVQKWKVDDYKKHDSDPEVPSSHSGFGGTTYITLGHEPLAKHLVRVHACPQWVVDYYKNDMEALVRIEDGYNLQSHAEDHQKRIDDFISGKNRFSYGSLTPPGLELSDMRKGMAYYTNQFKVLRVDAPLKGEVNAKAK